MDFERIREKLEILADAAKYDVSCSSSGGNRKNNGGLGNSAGICHSFSEDGRCISLLKILMTNHCIYDCAYCVSRRSNDIKRVSFTVEEVVDLTINFYRRNYIEGLFLSSGILKNADATMERLIRVSKKLRSERNFNGYIHLKTIPGASSELVREAGSYADRLSINVEIPTESGLKLLAPEKSHQEMIQPMRLIKNELVKTREESRIFRKAPQFSPAGQSTQMIIGATDETDLKIITVADYLYRKMELKRVYYSGYVPVLEDSRLPSIHSTVPVIRENRLYQADWLMRYYGFGASEIVDEQQPFLDLEIDPKLAWAFRNRAFFPVDVNRAPKEILLRIPGVGVHSVLKILSVRRFQTITIEHLKKMGVAVNRAKYFIVCKGMNDFNRILDTTQFRQRVLSGVTSKYKKSFTKQLSLF